jgi:pilus assembly protein CpaB
MKWSIVGLLFFGLVAALSATVLVASLRVGSRPANDDNQVEILVAAKALPRSKILDPDSIVTQTVSRKEAVEGFLTNAVQVVGKVLALPMVEGQPFTKACFASEGSGYRVASVLPDGMRAVTLSLFEYAGLYGLLYAGCTVDVIASFKMPAAKCGGNEAMSRALLDGIQVLAVEDQTLVSESKEGTEGKKSSVNQRTKHLLVTIMVTLQQANALQLAMQHGTVSLALRNPLDRGRVTKNPALLSQLVGYPISTLPPQLDRAEIASPAAASEKEKAPAEIEVSEKEKVEEPATPPQPPEPRFWKVTVIRGGVVSTQSFSLSR